MTKLFLDTNIVVDLLERREPFFKLGSWGQILNEFVEFTSMEGGPATAIGCRPPFLSKASPPRAVLLRVGELARESKCNTFARLPSLLTHQPLVIRKLFCTFAAKRLRNCSRSAIDASIIALA